MLTYVMEFVPGAWDRWRSNILEVIDLILCNLVDLAQLGERHDLSAVLPDTMGEFDAFLPQLTEDPGFRAVRAKPRSYAQIRRRLAAIRTLVAHNDIWGANVAVPVGGQSSWLINIGRISANYIGAGLLHFHRYYG